MSCLTAFRTSLIAAVIALAPQAAAQDPIEVRDLGALDPLEVSAGGETAVNDLWRGSTAESLRAVLSFLPDAEGNGYASGAHAALAAQILSAGARPPEGGRGDTELAWLRADRLLAAAGPRRAFALLQRTPGLERNERLAHIHAETGFALGETAAACRTAESLVDGRERPYWLRARAFCLALNGQAAAAELSAELAAAIDPYPYFDQLLFALTLGQNSAELPALRSGLMLALARTLAEDEPEVDMDSPSWLRELDRDAPVTPASITVPAAALAEARESEGARRAALLEAVIRQTRDPGAGAIALGVLLGDAAADGRLPEAARRHGRAVADIPVSFETLNYGYRYAFAALLAGDVAAARRWREGLVSGPPRPVFTPDENDFDKPDGDGPAALSPPPMSDASDRPEWSPPPPRDMVRLDLAIAIAADRAGDAPVGALVAARLESLGEAALGEAAALAALGAPVPAELRALLLETPPSPGSPALAAMEVAAYAGANGEAALLAAAALSEEAESPLSLMRAAAALDRAGMRRRALAMLLERLAAETM